MNRIIAILALSIFMVSGACDAPKTESANVPKTENTVVDSTKSFTPVTVADKGKTDAFVKSHSKETVEDRYLSQPTLITLIALIISVISLAFATVVFIFSKSRYKELYGRYGRVKNDIDNLSYEIKGDLDRRIASNGATLDSKINAVKEQILEELRAVHVPHVEVPETKSEDITKQAHPKFVSRTFFGIYKPKAKGVYLDQITDIRDGGSTFEIETISEKEALVHLVDNLSKTQFSGLIGDAVDVTEGSNPQSYDIISEVEAGRMKLGEETWTITKKILVQLS